MKTIGVSIPIPTPYASQLRTVRQAVGDPLADAVPPHITLMPPTDVRLIDLPAFGEHLRTVAATSKPFRMILRGTGTFRPISPVVFVQVARGIGECEQLESRVRQGPVERELEFPYHPHVTIAHHLDDVALDEAFDELADFKATFDVVGFDLYEHGPDGVWRSVDRFEFGSAPQGG
ncbi:2'-5' RNA ligase [Yimella lutea]|uniref:2'-5' RNA ligase n=2 Tax=Yimella lutea TaxID=587872 RepID=A0A542EJT6_9MICO|nr:2'-5' RNA ligase [Yimella lutea]